MGPAVRGALMMTLRSGASMKMRVKVSMLMTAECIGSDEMN
jgi:hypothetical protein